MSPATPATPATPSISSTPSSTSSIPSNAAWGPALGTPRSVGCTQKLQFNGARRGFQSLQHIVEMEVGHVFRIDRHQAHGFSQSFAVQFVRDPALDQLQQHATPTSSPRCKFQSHATFAKRHHHRFSSFFGMFFGFNGFFRHPQCFQRHKHQYDWALAREREKERPREKNLERQARQ